MPKFLGPVELPGDPTEDSQAATKGYTDASGGGGGPARTVADLFAQEHFYVAHRGSGQEYPEHTLPAYRASLAAGAQAIEVSVHSTSDGVLNTFHDVSMSRMTGAAGSLIDYPHGIVANAIPVNPRPLLGDGWTDVPIPTLSEVMNLLYGRCVIFLEAKTNPSVPLLESLILEQFPNAAQSVVWKGYYTHSTFATMKGHGFTTWGYVDAGTTDGQMDTYDANVDVWGVPHNMTDARIAAVVARGKPVICWEAHRKVDIERLTALGVQGFMAARFQYLTSDLHYAEDFFPYRISTPGMTGIANYNPDYAPSYTEDGWVKLDAGANQAFGMFGHAPEDPENYTIGFSMKWDTLPSSFQHSGVVFGRDKDDPYQFSATNDAYGDLASSGGYHLLVRGSGDFQLYTHQKGVTSGTQLAQKTVAAGTDNDPNLTAPVAGEEMTFTIQVTPTQVIATRTDTASPVVLTANHTAYRGPYWHLSNSSAPFASQPAWRTISVT